MIIINVFIQDNVIINNDLTDDAFLVYFALRQILKQDVSQYYVSVGYLLFTLIGSQSSTRLITSAVIKGMEELIKSKLIIEITNDKQYEWVCGLSSLIFNTDKSSKTFYTVINSDYITKILNSSNKDRIALLRFYCYLMSTVMKSGDNKGVGFTPYINMDDTTGISRQTISKYMDKLESLKVIHIYRASDSISIDGNVREIPNVYGDIRNKDKIISIGMNHEAQYGVSNKGKNKTNAKKTRSASAKYRVIENDLKTTGEIRYSYDEMKEIYETLVAYNKRYSHDEDLQKPLDVFSNYDFYKYTLQTNK